jgi:hypothetical protein
MANFPTELVVMGARTGLVSYNLPFDATKMPSFHQFSEKYGKLIIQAMSDK